MAVKDFRQWARSENENKKFMGIGSASAAVRVNDSTMATNKLSISGESVSFSAGAAGTTGVVALDKGPVYNSAGDKLGNLADSSFAWVTGTVLTSQVDFRHDQDDTTQLAALSQGEYAIDYDTGLIRYSKATTGTSDTCNYTSRQLNVDITTATVTAANNITQLNSQTINLGAGGVGTGTQRVTLAQDDVSVAIISALSLEEDTQHSSGDQGIMPLGVRNDTLAALGGTDGDYAPIQVDANGAVWVSLGTKLDATNDTVSTQPVEPSNANTSAYAASLVVKASAGTLYEVRGYNSSITTAYWIQVHDASSLPADTAVPEDIILVQPEENFYIRYPQGKSLGTGIVISNSSTGPTKTIGGADCWISAEYI
jgi:hypothetical protein